MRTDDAFEWQHQIDADEAGSVIAAAMSEGLVGQRRALMFHDLDSLARRIGGLISSFPPQTLHALAIKANPVVELLRFAVDHGMGLEAASIEEVALARAASCPPAGIVFDSPAKTREELREALLTGISLNADNLDEIARIADLENVQDSSSLIGLRVNTQVGLGSVGMLSVSGAYSKFGVPLGERREQIVEAFIRFPWLRALHLHVGSQGIAERQLASAVALVFELRRDIHARLGEERIGAVDIGGGLPWCYREGEEISTPQSFAAMLRQVVPAAFGNDVRLTTEYGRTLQAGCGFAASRVEYVKSEGGRKTAIIHFGADLLMRLVYKPEDWHHRISVLGPDGVPKRDRVEPYTVAGPLCFGGDLVARDMMLPAIAEGDWLVIHDVGAYTLGLWSRHCSRGLPVVLGYAGQPRRFRPLYGGETPDDVVRFWGLARERRS